MDFYEGRPNFDQFLFRMMLPSFWIFHFRPVAVVLLFVVVLGLNPANVACRLVTNAGNCTLERFSSVTVSWQLNCVGYC